MILDIIKWDHKAHNSIDKLVNHRNDFNIIKFLYEKLSENIDDVSTPERSNNFYSMVNRQLNECTKDPAKEENINDVIKDAIELMNTKKERDYLSGLLQNSSDYPNLIESCTAA